MLSTFSMMEFIVENRAAELSPKVLADLFDRLIWIMNDNGYSISKVRQQWLAGSDILRLEVALLMSETFPFNSRLEMEQEFLRISNSWPQFRGVCDQILEQWDLQSRK